MALRAREGNFDEGETISHEDLKKALRPDQMSEVEYSQPPADWLRDAYQDIREQGPKRIDRGQDWPGHFLKLLNRQPI